jgi:hypothetical protein
MRRQARKRRRRQSIPVLKRRLCAARSGQSADRFVRPATPTSPRCSADRGPAPANVTMQRVKTLFDRQGRGIMGPHDSQKNTVELLPMIIAELNARNMHIVHLTVE